MSAGRDAILGIGGPLGAVPDPLLVSEAFAAELAQQRQLFDDVGRADLAHVVMAVERGVIPAGDGSALLRGLVALQTSPKESVRLEPSLGDVYTNREAWLSENAEGAGWLGAGRARREAVTTGYTLAVRRAVLGLTRALVAAGEALVERAEREIDALMPDYTYLRAGQPTTFGHYLLGFAYALLRDLERVRELFARTNRCPAGCGSINGSSLPLDRGRLAELLGFDGLVEHARDAMWQADGPIEAFAVACAAIVNLDRLAEDLMLFTTAEFGFVELADEHSRASKAMPQKQNPFALAYVRALANRTIGLQAAAAAAGRTPSGQMDNRLYAYGDVPRTMDDVAGAASLLAHVVRGLRFDRAAARRALNRSWSFASDLAELVMRGGGVDYRSAHALVGALGRASRAGNGADPSLDDLETAARARFGRPLGLSPAEFARVLDPRCAVERRAGPGGAARASTANLVAGARESLTEAARWQTAAAERCSAADAALLLRSKTLAGLP